MSATAPSSPMVIDTTYAAVLGPVDRWITTVNASVGLDGVVHGVPVWRDWYRRIGHQNTVASIPTATTTSGSPNCQRSSVNQRINAAKAMHPQKAIAMLTPQ